MGVNGERQGLRNRLVPALFYLFFDIFIRSGVFSVREYCLLKVDYLCVSFFKVALIVVQVGLEANLVLIKFAGLTCIVFSQKEWK